VADSPLAKMLAEIDWGSGITEESKSA
jgi:hypothetical protein